MEYYHGTSRLFDEFKPIETIGSGEGKSKFGWGVYLTSSFATAVLYSGKGPGREAPDHYVYTVDIPSTDTGKFLVLHKAVPSDLIAIVEKEIGAIPKKDQVVDWALDFRKTLEEMLFVKANGCKPKGKEEGGAAQKMAADWLYSHGYMGLVWPQSKWPGRGCDTPVENLNVAMFNGADVKISKIERVEVEFVVKDKKNPAKKTCLEKDASLRKVVKAL